MTQGGVRLVTLDSNGHITATHPWEAIAQFPTDIPCMSCRLTHEYSLHTHYLTPANEIYSLFVPFSISDYLPITNISNAKYQLH